MLWYPYDARTVMGSKSPLHNPVCCRWDRVGTHLRRFLSMSVSGRHSLCLCGPGDGLGACTKKNSSSLSKHHQNLHHLGVLVLSELRTATS